MPKNSIIFITVFFILFTTAGFAVEINKDGSWLASGEWHGEDFILKPDQTSTGSVENMVREADKVKGAVRFFFKIKFKYDPSTRLMTGTVKESIQWEGGISSFDFPVYGIFFDYDKKVLLFTIAEAQGPSKYEGRFDEASFLKVEGLFYNDKRRRLGAFILRHRPDPRGVLIDGYARQNDLPGRYLTPPIPKNIKKESKQKQESKTWWLK